MDIDVGICTCRLEGSDYYNANSSSVPVIKAALCAGLYPQVQHYSIIARCDALGPGSVCAGGAVPKLCCAALEGLAWRGCNRPISIYTEHGIATRPSELEPSSELPAAPVGVYGSMGSSSARQVVKVKMAAQKYAPTVDGSLGAPKNTRRRE